jgi:uncharacterized protein (TIGR02588 family)
VKVPEKNWLEWMVFWAGLALVGGVAGYLAYAATTTGRTPPRLTIAIGEPRRTAEGFAVPVTVANAGDTTAHSVTVEVRSGDGGEGERAEVTLAFVPHGSERRGWVTFERAPDASRLRARVLGYEEP